MRLNCGDTAPRTANYKVISPAGEIVGSVYMREGDSLPQSDFSACHSELDKGKAERARPGIFRGARLLPCACAAVPQGYGEAADLKL